MRKFTNLSGTFCFLILAIAYGLASSSTINPYTILGIDRYATSQDIRRAYKQLAKEWHPDKNGSPEAEHKFVNIKQAYELLIDTDRRQVYDQHGITNEDSHIFKQKHDYTQYDRFAQDPFEEFFGKHFYFDQDISLYHKLSATSKYFEQIIIPKSATVPHILFFYNDWCFRCIRLVTTFKKIINILEPLGIPFATVNAAHEPHLIRRAGVNDVPSVVLVLDGYTYVYRDVVFSASKIVDFIRKKMPFKIMQKIDDGNIDKFLNGWMDNKVRILIVEPRNQTRLRYLLTAFAFRFRVTFGFVRLGSNCNRIVQKFKIHPNLDTLLIFNEDTERPVASVSMLDIPTPTLNNIISSNQYLTLPRLSSQDMLESVCPAEWNRPRKRLCIVLITESSRNHDFAREAFRLIGRQSSFNAERVRFAYIFKDTQNDFINAISKGSFENVVLRVVIIWRRDVSHLKYEWVNGADLNNMRVHYNKIEHVINATKYQIDATIHKLLKTTAALSYEAFVQNLLDEHAQGFFSKWLAKLTHFVEYLEDNVEQEHILATLSVIGTVIFMLAVGYIMVYFVKAEEASLKASGILQNHADKQYRYVPELKLYELRAEKYNGMVRLLKPGCRTIILITDLQSRTKLIPKFHKCIWPYRKSKTLIFGHMLIEKGLFWYTELLKLSLSEAKHLQINPRNCIGTVLALNGHRKYFCIYHAKHPEVHGGDKRMLKITTQLSKRSEDLEVGAFFEMDASDTESKILLEEDLLDSLSNWLDRLFEGTTHRYYINYWPDFPTK